MRISCFFVLLGFVCASLMCESFLRHSVEFEMGSLVQTDVAYSTFFSLVNMNLAVFCEATVVTVYAI